MKNEKKMKDEKKNNEKNELMTNEKNFPPLIVCYF